MVRSMRLIKSVLAILLDDRQRFILSSANMNVRELGELSYSVPGNDVYSQRLKCFPRPKRHIARTLEEVINSYMVQDPKAFDVKVFRYLGYKTLAKNLEKLILERKAS